MADDEVAELYGLPLDEFTARRNALARDLRKAGDTERAAEVAKLKRPTVAAWTVNQLARSSRKDMDLLLDAGHRLRTSQVEAVESGDSTPFAKARRDHEGAIRKLVGDASGSEQTLASVERTLRYASIDDEHRPALASGTLTTEVEAPGFGAFSGMALPPPSKPKPDTAAEQKKRVAAARADVKDAQGREREAQRRVAKAEQALEEARDALRAAEAETRDAEERLRDVT